MIKEFGAFVASKAGLTVGANLFLGWRPQSAAVACDVIQEYGGVPNFDNPDMFGHQVQIVSRAGSYHAARARAYAIYDVICKPTLWTIPALVSGGAAYLATIEANARPFYLGPTEGNGFEFVVNYTLHVVAGTGYEETAMIADSYQMRTEYDGDGRPLYVGLALPGMAETDAAWQIVLYEYDGDGNVTKKTYANSTTGFTSKWSDRAAYSYA